MKQDIERQIIEIIATDRIDRPISSMSGKLKRAKPALAREVDLSEYENNFSGERVYARIESNDVMKARGMASAISDFSQEYPRYGHILKGMIEEQRAARETHLYFGVQEGRKLTADDYMQVMTGLGFTEAVARGLYPELMDISHKIARTRQETERSILIG